MPLGPSNPHFLLFIYSYIIIRRKSDGLETEHLVSNWEQVAEGLGSGWFEERPGVTCDSCTTCADT